MKLGEWRNQFSDRYKAYIDELSQFGVETAQGIFDTAPPEYGNGGVSVNREFDGTVNFVIRASGHDASFLEFGTGVSTVVTRPTVQASFDISDGSWSREVNGEYARFGNYWHWNNQRFSGTPPLGAMQETCNTLEQWSSTIAGRVFR